MKKNEHKINHYVSLVFVIIFGAMLLIASGGGGGDSSDTGDGGPQDGGISYLRVFNNTTCADSDWTTSFSYQGVTLTAETNNWSDCYEVSSGTDNPKDAGCEDTTYEALTMTSGCTYFLVLDLDGDDNPIVWYYDPVCPGTCETPVPQQESLNNFNVVYSINQFSSYKQTLR